MTLWWDSMDSFQQVLFVIACATTLFMIVQIILIFAGSGDNDASFDTDADADFDTVNDNGTGAGFTIFGLKVLSVRGLVAFLSIGSWITFALFYPIGYWALFPGVIAGLAAMLAISAFMRAIEKMQNDGTLNINNAVGKTADVYLTIPAQRKGNGKINVYVQERYAEIEAVTDSLEPVKTGAKVKIIGSLNDGILLVEPMDYGKPESMEKEVKDNVAK